MLGNEESAITDQSYIDSSGLQRMSGNARIVNVFRARCETLNKRLKHFGVISSVFSAKASAHESSVLSCFL